MQTLSPRPSRLVRKIVEIACAVFVTALAGILFGYMNRPMPRPAVAPAVQARETPVDEYGMRFVPSENPQQAAEQARREADAAAASSAAAKLASKPAPSAPPRRVATAPERLRAVEPVPLPRNPANPPLPPAPPPAAAPPPAESSGSNVLAALRRIPGWFLPGSGSAPSTAAPPPAPPEPAEVDYPPRPPRPIGQFVQGTM